MAKAAADRFRRIEELVRRLDEIPNRESRDTARALMEAILELHGAGMERMMDIVFEQGDTGRAAIRRFAADELISSLLLLHDLHPDDLETRVHRALAKTHGNAELVSVFEGVVRVRLTGGGCGLRDSVEALVRDAAPDLVELVMEETIQPPSNDFVPLASIGLAVPGTA
jgi:Fe-S cluster biogenesis protein NfuA